MNEAATINFVAEPAVAQRLLRMVPIDLDKDGNSRNTRLGTALQEYAKREFGMPLVFAHYVRVWAIVVVRENDADYFEVMGAIGTRQTLDVPLFHVTVPSVDKEGLRIAEQARDMAVYRLHSFLCDFGNAGQQCLIYVSEKAERYWRRFLGKLKAKPANRYEITL